jgi:hypothetical protein
MHISRIRVNVRQSVYSQLCPITDLGCFRNKLFPSALTSLFLQCKDILLFVRKQLSLDTFWLQGTNVLVKKHGEEMCYLLILLICDVLILF